MLIDAKPSEQRNRDQSYAMSLMWNYFAFGIGSYAGEDNACFALVQGATSKTTPIKAYFVPSSDSIDYATTILASEAKTVAMFDGTTAPTAAPGLQRITTFTDSRKDTGYGIGGRTGGDYSLVGTVKNFRYYDRVLTEEEIIRNRNADAVRYFGALGVTNVLVQTKYGDVASDAQEVLAEEPGAYTVEGTWTFSATRVKDRLGALKDVAGYYTEELDARGNWTNKTWHEGKTAYTYDRATSPACVRLTWSVMPPGLILILR